ncbi:MAG: DUF29 domain-containing protein [Gammaproteobacteria bacterium]|nr:MAG: DUF29 domain-containing protein [Gammaproteobacteria bacterium]
METVIGYHEDFYSWITRSARLIREKRFTEIKDVEHIAEELESMSRSEKRELISRLTVLLAHLIKWKFQSIKRSRSWKNTILIQRIDINELLADSPSLRYEIEQKIKIAYEKAKLNAEDETGIDKKNFPAECPFTLEEMLNQKFFSDLD